MSTYSHQAAHLLAPDIEQRQSRDGTQTLFLSPQEVQVWLEASAPPPLPFLDDPGPGPQRVHIVLDHAAFAPRHRAYEVAERLMACVASSVGRHVETRILILQHGLHDGMAASALDRLIVEAAAPIAEALRRDPAHFSHAPLTFDAASAPAVHLLSTDAVRHFIDDRLGLLVPGAHVLGSEPLCSGLEFLHAVAQAAGLPVQAGQDQLDSAVADLMRLALRHHHDSHALQAGPQATLSTHTVSAPSVDWRDQVSLSWARQLASTPTARPSRLDSISGLQWRKAADGSVEYLRGGSGAQAILLINAFGQTDDVWHDLVQALTPHAKVLMIPDGPGSGSRPQSRVPSYGSEDSLRRLAGEVEVLLAAEGLDSCHVASWCAGSKLAFELARALPGSITSLSLFAPSFAGTAQATSGADSMFESSLNTMCRLVDRMPQSAESMARSMVASISKNAGTPPADLPGAAAGAARFALPDVACQPWLVLPFASAQSMVQYSRQLLNFRAHEVAGQANQNRLTLPVLLVTADQDSTTCSRRARDVCFSVCDPVHVELRHAGHYFIHQNSALTARLLLDFIRDGRLVQAHHPRIRHLPAAQDDAQVIGEL